MHCAIFQHSSYSFNLIDYRTPEEQWSGNSLTDVVMRLWIKQRPKLVHNYSLVGYLLSPNSTIMAHAVEHKTINHDQAAKQLITKLILNSTLVGTERNNERANLINTFMKEYGDFTNKHGMFARDNIWIMATDENAKAYQWHYKYSLPTTKVLGKLACLVLLKILGIGTTKRNWKQVKAVKSSQWVKTGINKTKKQVLIYAQYQQSRAQAQMTKLAAAGKFWEDEDFTLIKMDPFCKEIKESLQAEQTEKEVRVLRLWQERWELEKIGPNGDLILEARLTKKYKGLKIFDIDENNRVMTAHKMIFQKQRGKNVYHVFATMDGFNNLLKDEDEASDAYWQPWEVNEVLFDCMRLYYKEQADSNVKCYELGGNCVCVCV
jgi:hypothetical protein